MAATRRKILLTVAMSGVLGYLNTAQAQSSLRECAAVRADAERLACYDNLAKSTEAQASHDTPEGLATRQVISRPTTSGSPLGRAWELDAGSKTSTFTISTYRPMYFLLAQHSNDINTTPTSPAPEHSVTVPTRYKSTETRFQISAKTKVWQSIAGSDLDLWFAYTQQSNWQLYNPSGSAPFRNTDYEPEIILTVPVNRDALGMNLRMLNLGFSHQSNGRANPTSRSWNRVYAQVGLEHGDFQLLARPWWRVPESTNHDDNPDIDKYMGNGDLLAVYRSGQHVFSALSRYSFSGHRGALEADWAFPISGPLKGYVRASNGYGGNLIDYNHRQTTVGAGVAISTW